MSIIDKLGITPAPWEIGNTNRRESNLMGYCDDLTGSRIADCTNEYVRPPRIMKESNARLIATAPEMLEALIVIGLENTNYETRHQACRDLVEKATGKTWEEIKELDK